MLPVRWSPQAADDLTRIVDFIRQDSTEAARRIATEIYQRAGALEGFPNRGPAGARGRDAGIAAAAASLHSGLPRPGARRGNLEHRARRAALALTCSTLLG